MNEPPFRFTLNRAASDETAWDFKHCTGRRVMKFYDSGAALAQDLSVDLNDCVNDVQVISLQYCSDEDEINDTVSRSFIRVHVPLVRSSCSLVGEMMDIPGNSKTTAHHG